MRDISRQRNKKWLIAFWLYFTLLITIFTMAYLRIIPVKIKVIPYYDTIGHFVLYGITAYLAHRALDRKTINFKSYIFPLAPVIISIFAIIEESLQSFSPYRTFSLLDIAANISGIYLFYWFDTILPPWDEIHFISIAKRFIKLINKFVLSAVFAFVVFLTLGLTKGVQFELITRYDFLFIVFVLFQIVLIVFRFESKRDLYIIMSFHILGLFMEMYKVHFGAWSYPEAAYTKVLGVPLYSGFMYGSVAGFLLQVWRRLNIRLLNWPQSLIVAIIGLMIYFNFFSMDISKEFRAFLVLVVVFLFSKSRIEFVNTTKKRSISIILAFAGLGIFVWIAENIATFLGAWAYPYQLNKWQMVHLSKINSWFLLGIICFILVAQLIEKRRNCV